MKAFLSAAMALGLMLVNGLAAEKRVREIQDPALTIFMIGDSTMANKPLTPPKPERGWGQLLPIYFAESVRIENHAMNGRSARSFIAEGRWKTVLERFVAELHLGSARALACGVPRPRGTLGRVSRSDDLSFSMPHSGPRGRGPAHARRECSPSNHFCHPDGLKDDTHLNAVGATRVCDLAVAEIGARVPQLAPYLRK